MLDLNLLIVKVNRATLVWLYKLASSSGSLMLWKAVLLTLVIFENEYIRSFAERKSVVPFSNFVLRNWITFQEFWSVVN